MATKALSRPRRVEPVLGKVMSVGDITSFGEDSDKNVVLNVNIETIMTNSLGLAMNASKRIVLFYELAKKAAQEIKEGDYICFDECSTQDRAYTSKTSGEEVLTSDIIAKQFMVLDRTVFETVQKKALKGAFTEKYEDVAEIEEDDGF